MVHAVIAHVPLSYSGKVKSFDDKKALRNPKVCLRKRYNYPDISAPVMFQPLGGVAVIAQDTWSAIQGRNALEVEWDTGPNGSYDSEAFNAELLETVRKPGVPRLDRGEVDAALAAGAETGLLLNTPPQRWRTHRWSRLLHWQLGRAIS